MPYIVYRKKQQKMQCKNPKVNVKLNAVVILPDET